MTDQVSDTRARGSAGGQTRRQLIAGGGGALAAVLTAEVLARPAPAAAANGDNVVLGHGNSETATTSIMNSASGVDALECSAKGGGSGIRGDSEVGDGVRGESGGEAVHGISVGGNGVRAESSTGRGVLAESGSNEGVYGQSGNPTSTVASVRNGVHGITDSASGAGVLGENVAGGPGVEGISTGGTGVAGTASAGGDGVTGSSDTGRGVQGTTAGTAAAAVAGKNTGSGPGVHGDSAAGTGVLATGTTALQVRGPALFSRSGVLTVAAGRSSAVKTGVALTKASLILALLHQDVAGVWVRSAVPDPGASKFTVHLNKAAPAKTAVAWFLVN